MNRGLACLIALLVPWGLAVAQPAPPSVYIDSSPLGARIVLDGVLTEARTPVLLRGLSAGNHQVALWKAGFLQVSQSFAVVAGKVPVVKANLPPESVVLAFPVHEQVLSPEGPLSTANRQFRFPSGAYFLSGSEDSARLTPIFDDAGMLDTSGWFLALSAGAALASGTQDLLRWRTGNLDRPSPLTIGLLSSTVGELAWYWSLQTRKARFYGEVAPIITAQSQRLDQASVLYREGNQALETGDLTAAEDLFRRVIRSHPDSKWVPGSWFRLAKIHSVTGRRDLALGEYRLVADAFAQPEFHDRARQALADLNEAAGNEAVALEQLDLMVLTDGFFDKDAVAAQRKRLVEAKPQAAEVGEEGDTSPRRGYERTLTLFAAGHTFTAEELVKFDALKEALVERDDGDLAADLELVRWAVGAAAAAAETSDGDQWRQADATQRNRQNWRALRDAGLTLFRVSSAVAIGASVVYDKAATDAALWVTGGALGTLGFSLFPLLWSEPRQ